MKPAWLSRLLARAFVALQYLLPHHGLSRLAGRLADSRQAWLKTLLINAFRRHYGVDLSEAEIEDPDLYPDFNAFFTRALKPGARPIAGEPGAIACPADGTISQIGSLRGSELVQAKGRHYSLFELFGGNGELAGEFAGGDFATVYLSPRDYHRVHMPVDGTLTESLYIPGRLFSVNQATTELVPRLFARNERLVSVFDTQQGPVAVILVGAMIVAGIETVYAGRVTPGAKAVSRIRWPQSPLHLQRGEEVGRFLLGSTVIVVFPPGRCRWKDGLGPESPVRMGQTLGTLKTTKD